VRALCVVSVLAALLLAMPGGAAAFGPPTPDPNFLGSVTPSPCKLDTKDPVEKSLYEREGWGASTNYERYPGNCRRIHFAYGPIIVKPGQNDVLIQPVTIDKPGEDGYITRIKPNLVDQNGAVPPVEQVHLHHGTWLAEPNYGNSAFFAAGEEKTIAPWPKGYGMPYKATDAWLLLYMVHSAVQNPMAVWITYDVDFIPQANAMALGLKPALPVWLDVRPSAYPVFNVQRKYGGPDGQCTWPKESCADFDPYGKAIPGNGQPANGKGTDFKLPDKGGTFGMASNFQGGTIIGLGGHLHPGGLQNEIDLVRNGEARRIYNGVPSYWDRTDPSKPGGPKDSWDFSMRVSGLPTWGVHVNPGDVLRSNATYDTTGISSYEDMGIAVGLLVPDTADGKPQAPGLDPFSAPVDDSARCDSGGLQAATPTLCPNGSYETHGHYPENGNYSGPSGDTKLDAADGPATTNVAVGDFIYAPGDLSTIGSTGIPTVKLGSDLTFTNADSGLSIYHTITTCAFPCTGATGAAFPLANGLTSLGRPLDLDSAELGYGVPEISGVKNEAQWSTPITPAAGYRPGEVVTYFCRIHPSMRGAFKVVE
jgi:plastocyanin